MGMGMGGPGMPMQGGYGGQGYGQQQPPQQQQHGSDGSAQQPAPSSSIAPSTDGDKAASGEDADLDVAPVSFMTALPCHSVSPALNCAFKIVHVHLSA